MPVPRVLIDGHALFDSNRFRGIGVYVRSLLAGLAGIPAVSVRVMASAETPLPDGIDRIGIRRLPESRFTRIEHGLRRPLDMLGAEYDVFHSPALEAPRRCARPWVQTIHDVTPLVFGDPAFAAAHAAYRRLGHRARRASMVITDSRYSADEAIHQYRLDPSRVEVISLGVGAAFKPAAGVPETDAPYLLYVGEYGPNKGYPEAFKLVGRMADMGYPHRLKVVGRLAPWVEPGVRRLVAESDQPARIDLLGFVDEDTLVALYQAADALVVTSRYEGFGLPALEAMACGSPVVAFSNSSLREVVGDGGVLVPDGDVEAMAEALRGVTDSQARRAEVVAAGLGHARRFTWRACAEAHAAVYQAVAGQ